MAQKLYTKKFGMIEVLQSWVVIGEGGHIAEGLDSQGRLCWFFITGLPIRSKTEGQAVLTGEVLQRFEEWFDNRQQAEEDAPLRIMFDKGVPYLEDGTPATTADLIQALPPGALLDAALLACLTAQKARTEVQALADGSKAGEAVKEMLAEKPVPKDHPSRKKQVVKVKRGTAGKFTKKAESEQAAAASG